MSVFGNTSGDALAAQGQGRACFCPHLGVRWQKRIGESLGDAVRSIAISSQRSEVTLGRSALAVSSSEQAPHLSCEVVSWWTVYSSTV